MGQSDEAEYFPINFNNMAGAIRPDLDPFDEHAQDFEGLGLGGHISLAQGLLQTFDLCSVNLSHGGVKPGSARRLSLDHVSQGLLASLKRDDFVLEARRSEPFGKGTNEALMLLGGLNQLGFPPFALQVFSCTSLVRFDCEGTDELLHE
ncbi:MAG: hypothetical protein RL291_1151, partial [Pseudomonadota bacterium]